jgi:hypothetical protein
VAAAAQTTLDRVMGYAVPVLAERAHIADRAQRASVRRAAGEGSTRVLADAVAERLRSRNVDPAVVRWDAWRREDGRWTVVADYHSGESARHAEFAFDAPGRYVVAEDDEARWLVGEQTAVKGPQPRATPGPRRLSAVGSGDELPLGDDAIELVRSAVTVELGSEADEDAPRSATDVGTTGTTSGPAAASPPSSPDGAQSPGDQSTGDHSTRGDATRDEEVPVRATRKRRASVPSWDDIMFGGGKRE